MPYELILSPKALDALEELERRDERKLRKIRKTLGLLQQDPTYPSLNSHKYLTKSGPDGCDLWESYVENKTPAAWRVFWSYGKPGEIEIIDITPHP